MKRTFPAGRAGRFLSLALPVLGLFALWAYAVGRPGPAPADGTFPLRDGQRVVFLGDSNTFDGKFIAYLDAYLCTRFPRQRIELINLGLPSETVSGLSEPDHPDPRPNVHDRAARALKLTRPDVVVIGYGMNDGIYYPFSEERFKKYQDGVRRLLQLVERAGARPILLTPAPFDPGPLRGKVQGRGADKFSWLRPYERYDEEVLTRYSDWLVSLRAEKYLVVDAHAALLRHLAALRRQEPGYRVSADGIHPNADGHLVIALEFLKEWRAPGTVANLTLDVRKDLSRRMDIKVASVRANRVAFSATLPRPMPADPAWTARARTIEDFAGRVNRYRLKIDGLTGDLTLTVSKPGGGERRAPVSAAKVAAGLDVDLPSAGSDSALMQNLIEKDRTLGLAWLTHVGHNRRGTPRGLPLGEAKKRAAALDGEIRKQCLPVEMHFTAGPLGK